MNTTTAAHPAMVLLERLFEPNDLVEIRTKPEHGKGIHQAWHKRDDVTDDVLEELARRNGNGEHIYFGVCPRTRTGGGKREDVAPVRCLWADLDGGCKPAEGLFRCTEAGIPRPTITVSSGGGTHLYWVLTEPLTITSDDDRDAIEDTLQRLQKAIGGDHCHDLPRCLRAPGFVNLKYPKPCEIDSITDLHYSILQIEEALPLPEPEPEGLEDVEGYVDAVAGHVDTVVEDVSDDLRDEITTMLSEPTDDRSKMDFAALCKLAEHGVSESAAWELVRGKSKFAERDREYFHGTWTKATKAARTGKKKPKSITPMGHARKLLAEHYRHADGVCLRWWNGVFYEWSGRCYLPIAGGDMRARIIRWLDRHKVNATRNPAAEVIAALESLTLVPADVDLPAFWNGERWTTRNLLVAANGLLDVDQLIIGVDALTPHTPKWFSTFALPYAYDPAATCPVWFETLDADFDGDTECVNALSEFFGYALTPETKWHLILMLEGPPRSGKSLLLRILRAMVGDANCVSPRLSMLAEQFGLQGLLGKRVAICPDAHLGHGDKAMAVLETLKSVSGEDAVEVHRKHLPSVTTRLRTRFALACNELPRFGDSATALASRLLILPCHNSFRGREDRDLEAKLLPELPGILNWALDGLRRLHRSGIFTKPEASKVIEQDFERLTSPMKAFLDECCVVRPGASVDRLALFGSWRAWCDANGHHAGSVQRFGANLRLFVPGLDRTRPRRDDGMREYRYVGVALKSGVEVSV